MHKYILKQFHFENGVIKNKNMKKILLYTLLLFAPIFLWGQTTTTSFNLRCEDCETEGDEDGDGFADCEDLDCLINTSKLKNEDSRIREKQTGCNLLSNELIDYIQELYDENIIDVCNRLNTQALLNNVLSDCGQGCSVPEFEELLEKEDRIIIDPSFSNNEKMNCVWEKFTSNDNNVLCDMTSYFFGASIIDLKYTVEDFRFDEANARTSDKEINSKGVIKIRFNQEYVETSCEVSLTKTLIHENIHAEMYRVLNDPTININDFAAIYEADRQRRGWQHEVMSEYFRDKIEQSLKSIYGSIYTDTEYEALAWQGLNETIYEGYTRPDGTIEPDQIVFTTEAWTNLTEAERQSIRDTHESIKSNCEKDCTNN